jgi:hypothetical protein
MLALLLSPQFVVAINNPIMWKSPTEPSPRPSEGSGSLAIGVSGYVGIARHQALRVNYATYATMLQNFLEFAPLPWDLGDGTCAASVGGHMDDLGVGWMYFFPERWQGLTLEVGAVRKSMHLWHCMNDQYGEYASETHTTSTAYVARAMVGWSALAKDRLFVSFAGGLSAGREAGTDDDTGARFHHLVADPEVYFRIGFAFL